MDGVRRREIPESEKEPTLKNALLLPDASTTLATSVSNVKLEKGKV